MTPTDITSLLGTIETEVAAFRQKITMEAWSSHSAGHARIFRKNGQTQVTVKVPDQAKSNHAEITLPQKVERVTREARAIHAALEAYLPGHDLGYAYDPSTQKHALIVDGREALEAVTKSWADQLPLLKRILGPGGAGPTWILDTHMSGDSRRYNTSQMVKAPDLANALLRSRFFDMTLTHRKRPGITGYNVYAAAQVAPHPDVAATPNVIDAQVVKTAWEDMLSSLDAEWPWPTTPNLTLQVNLGAPDIKVDKADHPLLSAEDDARQQKALRRARAGLENFARRIFALAPHTDFSLVLHKMPRNPGWIAKFCTVGEEVSEHWEVAQRIAESEKLGGKPQNLYACVNHHQVTLRHARSPEEAEDAYQKALGDVDILPLVPATLAEIADAEAQVESLWKARRKATRRKKTDS